jgi:hypothetical protein
MDESAASRRFVIATTIVCFGFLRMIHFTKLDFKNYIEDVKKNCSGQIHKTK